jgi:hypothetical protein
MDAGPGEKDQWTDWTEEKPAAGGSRNPRGAPVWRSRDGKRVLVRDVLCPREGCTRAYCSETALRNHIRRNHSRCVRSTTAVHSLWLSLSLAGRLRRCTAMCSCNRLQQAAFQL